MKVLWTHNWKPPKYPPLIVNTIEILKDLNLDIRLEYLGNLKSPINVLKKIKYLNKISKDYDLVHAQYGSMCGYISSKIKNTPKIISLHGNDLSTVNQLFTYEYLHTRLSRFLTINSLDKFETIISVSERMKKDILQNNFKSRVIVIPYPINLNNFKIRNKLECRSLLGLNKSDYLINFNISNLNDSVKRLQLAKDTIKNIKKKIPNVKLHIVSGVDYKDVPLNVSACDLTLLTSENEGWPNSIKESLACNIPFVSTDVSDLSEIADQEDICRISKADIRDLSKNIIYALKYREKFNLRKYVKDMDIKKTGIRIKKLYEETINS